MPSGCGTVGHGREPWSTVSPRGSQASATSMKIFDRGAFVGGMEEGSVVCTTYTCMERRV